MICKVRVTFEYETSPPEMITIDKIEAGGIQTIAHRAITKAKKLMPKSKWSSIVILIERLPNEALDSLPENIESEKIESEEIELEEIEEN